MKKKQFMYVSLAATALASCMTSCIENEEGSGLEQLRKDLGNKLIAEGEAAKIKANAELVTAQAGAKLTEAQAATEQAKAAQEQAKVDSIASLSKLQQIETQYKEDSLKLELAKKTAQNEADLAEIKLKADSLAAVYEVAKVKAEKDLVDAQKALASAQNDAKAAAIKYEIAIIEATDSLEKAKKAHEYAAEQIAFELDSLETIKEGRAAQLKKLEAANMTAEQAADAAIIKAELAEISTALTNYASILKAVNDAYDKYAKAEGVLIDANATFAKATDAYNDAEITNAATKAAKILAAEQKIEDAEAALDAKERAVIIAEIGVDYAEANLEDFKKIELEKKEAVIEAVDALKQDVQALELEGKEYDQKIAAYKGNEQAQAKDALKNAKDASDKKFDEKIAELAAKVYAKDDTKVGLNDETDDQKANIKESVYSEKEQADQKLKDTKDNAYEALVKTNAEKGKDLVGKTQTTDGSLTEEITKLKENNQKTMDELKETAAYVKAYDELQKWNDTAVKSFAITIAEDIAADFRDTSVSPATGWLTEAGSQDVNNVTLYDVKDGKITLDESYMPWLCNSMLTTNGAYKYNYRVSGTEKVLNNYLNLNGLETEIKLERNVWTNDVNKENPVSKLYNFCDSKHAYYTTQRAAAVRVLLGLGVGADISAVKSADITKALNAEKDVQKDLKAADPTGYAESDAYKASVKKVSDYTLNDAKMTSFKAMVDEIDALRKTANDAKKVLTETLAEADTDLGVAYKNATDATRAAISKAEAQKATNVATYEKTVKEAEEANTAAVKKINEEIAALEKEIATEKLNKTIAYKDLKEYAAYAATEKVVKDMENEKAIKVTQPLAYKKALVESYKKIVDATGAEGIEKAVAQEIEKLQQAIETAEQAVVTAERAVTAQEVAISDAKDALAKIENDTYDAQAAAEDTYEKAKIALEQAKKDAADAYAEYEAAVKLYEAYQKAE